METPTILQGNTFTLAIPLRVYIIDEGGVVLEDYTPDEGDEVVITLKGPRRFYIYTPRIDGNVARIDLGGYELCGLYSVAVAITKDDGQKLRTYRGAQLSIVESIDAVTDSELEQGIEQGVLYLDAATFLSGADGRGIESVVKTATAGLVDTYTITYTDGTTSTFDVTNGHDGEDGQPGAPGTPGEDGVGILSIAKTGTVGLVDIYTIALTNGNTTTFEVTNGKDGVTPDMSDYYNKTETNTLLGGKQDTLVSGTSIKTINNTSLLGSGNMSLAPWPFVVSITDNGDNTYTADKTFAEVLVAYNGGAAVYFSFDNVTSQAYLSLGAIFIAIFHYGNVLVEVMLSEDGVDVTIYTLLTEGSLKTINNESLEGSGNLALATAAELAGKADITTLVEVAATGDVSQALDSGKFYRFGEVDSLALTFNSPQAGMGMWAGKFTASANWSALGIPDSIDEAAGNDTVAGGKTYEFNMVDNVIVIKEV